MAMEGTNPEGKVPCGPFGLLRRSMKGTDDHRIRQISYQPAWFPRTSFTPFGKVRGRFQRREPLARRTQERCQEIPSTAEAAPGFRD